MLLNMIDMQISHFLMVVSSRPIQFFTELAMLSDVSY